MTFVHSEPPSSVLRSKVDEIDERVDGWFTSLRGNPTADRVFYTASALGDFGLIWVMLALLRALRGRPNDRRAALRAIVASGTESVLVNVGLKSIFQRRRPLAPTTHPLPFRQPLTSSFPSGHATAAFCAARLLADGDDLAPLYYAAAIVVAASRIHVRIHHASDVAGGAVIGLVLGRIAKRISPLPDPPVKGIRSR
ncbi:MAG: phosphatase PAP2 family protein [Acidimicrobiales bacterium]